MDPFTAPAPGTRFTYTRFKHFASEEIEEQWSGVVVMHYIDSIGEHTVEARRDNGGIETFWNGSFAGTPHELIEIVPG